MKVLTVNFLTCAVKTCKSSLSSSINTKKHPSEQSPIPTASPASNELSPFPLHFRDAVLERAEINYNPLFIQNILPRVNWEALTITAEELGLTGLLPSTNPVDGPGWSSIRDSSESGMKDGGDGGADPAAEEGDEDGRMEIESERTRTTQEKEKTDTVLRQLHTLLLETSVTEGKLVCGRCGFAYPIKEGVGNFLLPAHLV